MFATVAELVAKLQIPEADVSEDDELSMLQELEGLSALIEGRTGGVLLHEDAVFEAENCRSVWLPHVPKVPVIVTAVEVDGEPFEGWRKDRFHRVRRTDGAWWRGVVTVTYDFGFAVPPADLKDVVLSRAARRFPNPEAVLQQRMGSDRSVSFADSSEAATGWDSQEKAVVESYVPVAVA